MNEISILQKHRSNYQPKLPPVFAQDGMSPAAREGEPVEPQPDQEAIGKILPRTSGLPLVAFEADEKRDFPPLVLGVVLSGGQAPGGHNVIAGMFDAIRRFNPESRLYGFLGGPGGLIANRHQLLTAELVDQYRNTGGFDIIGSGRTKLETAEQFDKAAASCRELGINALVVVGGDDSNTNAALLAEHFLQNGIDLKVIGCPKTIDGDLKNKQIEISFGFDTATKVYCELLGNIQRDDQSAKKYWHFIRVMGRSASHIALECALQCHPNITIISEEVAEKGMRLKDIAEYIVGIIDQRSRNGMDYGVVVIPEGLIEFIPEIRKLISELNDLMAGHKDYFNSLPTPQDKHQYINQHLTAESAQAFASIPEEIQWQLLEDRDPHGNVQVSRIETEKLLIDMVGDLLRERKAEGRFAGKFSPQSHFFGYEGRCAAPSNFDADYCYSLGYAAAALAACGKTGYMARVSNLAEPAANWVAGGVPLAMMMNMERRHGREVPVIRKALVDLNGGPFGEFARQREAWAAGNDYIYPGPIQYFGPAEVCDRATMTLVLEQGEDILNILNGLEVLQDSDVFSSLGPEAMIRLLSMVQRLNIKPGQIVIRRGDIGQCFYIVMDGQLEVMGKDDKTPVATLGAGAPFGEIALLTDVPRTATVVAKTDGSVLFLNSYDFKEFLSEFGNLGDKLEKLGAQRLKELKERE
jgi:pyrophosphate--fructose-6-phosphate 1-phosphotransferase